MWIVQSLRRNWWMWETIPCKGWKEGQPFVIKATVVAESFSRRIFLNSYHEQAAGEYIIFIMLKISHLIYFFHILPEFTYVIFAMSRLAYWSSSIGSKKINPINHWESNFLFIFVHLGQWIGHVSSCRVG